MDFAITKKCILKNVNTLKAKAEALEIVYTIKKENER